MATIFNHEKIEFKEDPNKKNVGYPQVTIS